MENPSRKSGDLWSGLALAALGLYIVVQAWQWEYLGPDGPGPGFFPLWYGLAIFALSVLLVGSHFRRAQPRPNPVDWNRVGRALSAWLALAVSLALFNTLGFVVSFALLTYFIVAVMYRRSLRTAAFVAIATGAGFYLVFDRALDVSLPAGLLGY